MLSARDFEVLVGVRLFYSYLSPNDSYDAEIKVLLFGLYPHQGYNLIHFHTNFYYVWTNYSRHEKYVHAKTQF